MVIIDQEKCIGCGQCVKDCIAYNLEVSEGKAQAEKECMKCGHCVAVCPQNAVSIPEYEMGEVAEYKKESFQIAPENFLNAVKFRRSIRKYKEKKIERDKLERVLKAGQYTETAVNYQDVQFIMVQDRLEELKPLIWEGWEGYARAIEASHPGMARYILSHCEAHQQDSKTDRLFFNAPALLVVAADVALDGGLASANVENMAVAEGLGALFNGYVVRAINQNDKARKWLGIDPKKEISASILLGYPDITYRRTAPRRKADIIWK